MTPSPPHYHLPLHPQKRGVGRRTTYMKALQICVAAVGVNVVSVGIFFWHLQFKEKVRKIKDEAAKRGRLGNGTWYFKKERTPSGYLFWPH